MKTKKQITPHACLYVIATPIGNLADITYRAVEILHKVDLILAEDKRMVQKILNHYQIKEKKLLSYNAYQENTIDIERFCNKIFIENQIVALLTDRGTPTISDPGNKLIQACRTQNIHVDALPGPSAVINALVLSGFLFKTFYFYGFLPNKKGKRKKHLQMILTHEKKVIVFYESPYRLRDSLQNLFDIKEDLPIFVAREMTKKFEEQIKGTAAECYQHFQKKKVIKGELVIVVNNSE